MGIKCYCHQNNFIIYRKHQPVKCLCMALRQPRTLDMSEDTTSSFETTEKAIDVLMKENASATNSSEFDNNIVSQTAFSSEKDTTTVKNKTSK